jgi:hypothetical protein
MTIKQTKVFTQIAIAGVFVIGFGLLANAGDVNPPAGPVGSTMVTLDDLNTSIAGIGSSCCAEACTPAMSGTPNLGAVLEIQDLNNLNSSAYDFAFSSAYGIDAIGCVLSSSRLQTPITISRDISCPESAEILNAHRNAVNLQNVTIRLYDSSNTNYITYSLDTVKIAAVEHSQTERCDGTYQQIERITFISQELTVECAGVNAVLPCFDVPAS